MAAVDEVSRAIDTVLRKAKEKAPAKKAAKKSAGNTADKTANKSVSKKAAPKPAAAKVKAPKSRKGETRTEAAEAGAKRPKPDRRRPKRGEKTHEAGEVGEAAAQGRGPKGHFPQEHSPAEVDEAPLNPLITPVSKSRSQTMPGPWGAGEGVALSFAASADLIGRRPCSAGNRRE